MSFPGRVLLVAPDQGQKIENQAETLSNIVNSGLSVFLMAGTIDHQNLTREIVNGGWNRDDLLLWWGHGNKDGVQLSDSILPMALLSGLLRGRFGYIYLATCEGIYTAQMLQSETNATIISTIDPLSVDVAYQVASDFAKRLSDSGNVEMAYRDSRPGHNIDFVMLAGGEQTDELSFRRE